MKILNIKTPKALLGKYGEKMARRYLRRHGYRIIKKNFVAESNEIDIIAENRETLAFVEVKTRTIGHENPNEPRPASSVDQKKQRGIIKAATFYTAYNPTPKKKRFDIVEVYVNQKNGKYYLAEIKHLINTFNLNTAYERPRK
ncbi:MAG: YraN family protein [Clostridia bacterium]|nr:YraN family protein [Clostridia bacterium]